MKTKIHIITAIIFSLGVSAFLLQNRYANICIEELEPYGAKCIETKDFKYCYPTLAYNKMEICGAFDAFEYMEQHCLQNKLKACETLITGYGDKGDNINAKKWNTYSCALARKQGVTSSFECK